MGASRRSVEDAQKTSQSTHRHLCQDQAEKGFINTSWYRSKRNAHTWQLIQCLLKQKGEGSWIGAPDFGAEGVSTRDQTAGAFSGNNNKQVTQIGVGIDHSHSPGKE